VDGVRVHFVKVGPAIKPPSQYIGIVEVAMCTFARGRRLCKSISPHLFVADA
jgi:hypothetical protein